MLPLLLALQLPYSRAQNVNFAVMIDSQGHIGGLGQVRCYHVSCHSSRLDSSKNLAGIVLYGKGTSTEWQHNGMKFSSGYIYITDADSVSKKFPDETGQIHGAAYRLLTGSSKPTDITAGGFSIQKGTWKFNSVSMNAFGDFTTNTKTMSDHEKRWVKAAVEQWMLNGQQNYCLNNQRHLNPAYDFLGKKVFIKTYNGFYLQDHDWRGKISNNPGQWETWTIVDAGDGTCFIKSYNGFYLQDHDWVGKMSANRKEWEKWSFFDAGNGRFYIKSYNGFYLQSHDWRAKMSGNPGEWERWSIVPAR
jgi:hypothetical protein